MSLVFDAPVDAWPASFPSTATCTSGSYSLVATLVAAPMAHDYDLDFTPSIGISIASSPNVGFGRTYRLPTGPAYVQGTWAAKLSPTTSWVGVACSMHYGDDSVPYLQVSARPAAAGGSGFCVLPSGSGVPHAVALTITR